MTGARRLDWRFLLPRSPGEFDHLILLGADAGLSALAAELGIARRVSVSLSDGQSADLIAVLNGARTDPRRVAASLRPGGVWYWEVDGRPSARAASRLERAGLDASTVYWVRGGFTAPRSFVPLGRDGVLAWYFTTIFRSSSFGRRALRAGLRLLTGWHGPRFARLIRRHALVGADGRPPAVLSAVGPDPAAHDPRPLVLLGGEGEWSRVTFVPFPPSGDTPAVVLKIARRPAFTGRTAHEQRLLRELCTRAPPRLGRSIPQPLGFFDWRGLGVGVERCAAGALLHGEISAGRRRAARALTAAGRWLAALHTATERGRLRGQTLRERIVGAPLADYETAFGYDAEESRLFACARRYVERKDTWGDLPVVLEHGDFGPWNVFRDGHNISVVDWETAHEGPPLCDLLYFMAHWDVQSRGVGLPEAAQRLTIPLSSPRGDRIGEIMRRVIVRYQRRLGLAGALYPLLVLYTFVEQALDRVARLREQGDPGAAGRAANPYVACVGALARKQERLFAEQS